MSADRRALIVAIIAGAVGSALGSLINLFFLPGELLQWRGIAALLLAVAVAGFLIVQQLNNARRLMPLRTFLAIIFAGFGGSVWVLTYQPIVTLAAESGYGKWESLLYPLILYGSQWVGIAVLGYKGLQLKDRFIPMAMFVGSTAMMIGAAWLHWWPEGHFPQWPVLIAAAVPPVLIIVAVTVYIIAKVGNSGDATNDELKPQRGERTDPEASGGTLK